MNRKTNVGKTRNSAAEVFKKMLNSGTCLFMLVSVRIF